jgi:hypothetical protein
VLGHGDGVQFYFRINCDCDGEGVPKSRFFAHHPRTYPKELTLFRAPDTFGAPFTQNDGGG